MDVNIQKYQAFLKAVEYGSFTKAAEALSYSQSGISRMIGDLEQEYIGDLLAQLLVDATRCGCLLHVYSLRATCSMR